MKVGLDIDTDIKHVEAVRKAIGPDIKLMIDANHAYRLVLFLLLFRKKIFFENGLRLILLQFKRSC